MKKLIIHLAALSVIGAATAATAQDAQQDRRDAAADRRQDAGDRHHNEAVRNMDRRQDIGAARHDQAVGNMIARDNFANYRRNVQATQRFRAGGWRAPPGWAYRRWTFGQRLPGIFWGRDYWINNWVAFGLFAPPPGLVWVRYGPDALLINRYTGEVVQVRYGLFY